MLLSVTIIELMSYLRLTDDIYMHIWTVYLYNEFYWTLRTKDYLSLILLSYNQDICF